MPPEIKIFLITATFVLILLLMFIWLVRALIPSERKQAKIYKGDKFDLAGYETVRVIRRKEYTVISLSVFLILLCLAIMGGLVHLIISAGFAAAFEDQRGLNIILILIPIIIFLVLVIKASSHYVQTTQNVLREFRKFTAARDKALAEYRARRAGKGKKKK